MKRIFYLLVAAASFAPFTAGATRPHYGGALRIEMRGSLASFDLAPTANSDRQKVRDLVLGAVCDRLTRVDSSGVPQRSLASSWRSERENRSWYFTLRDGIILHNGSALSQQMAIAALSAANPDWHIRAGEHELVIQSDTPIDDLLYELAQPRNSICAAADDGRWIGSGPFRIVSFEEGQTLVLQAFDDAWQGRPFLDKIQITMNKPVADQATDLQLSKADIIELDPTQQKPSSAAAISATRPIDLLALSFTPNHPAASDVHLRENLARSIDRVSIASVLLRREGEASGGLLPEWISGYAHLFGTERNASANPSNASPQSLTLAYASNDAMARLIAERVALNARGSGILIEPRPETPAFRGFNADLQLVRLRIDSPDTAAALVSIGEMLDISSLLRARSMKTADQLYGLENETAKNAGIIPLAIVPETTALAPSVHDWMMTAWGDIDLGNVWVEVAK
jgi:MarR-like DNA-binding transcriptional regulator SgrR of sgrS sRNA